MNQLSLPCCYFPTRTVVIDEMKAFSDALCFHLRGQTEAFNNAVTALERLKKYTPAITENDWLKSDINSELADGTYRQPLIIDTHKIQAIQHHRKRYQDISVLIMDYHMPQLNGLTLLQQLADKPFKKILLTGESDHVFAVETFNQGLIDYFLRKDDSELYQKIDLIIQQLQYQYFIDMSRKSREIFKLQLPLFSSGKMADYFYQELLKKQIQEFYLINLQGNYLLINQEKQKQYFCAYTNHQLKKFAQYSLKDNANTAIIAALQAGKKIPFFGTEKAYWEIPANQWEDYLYVAETITAENYLFSVSTVCNSQHS